MKTRIITLYAYNEGFYSTFGREDDYLIWSAVLKIQTTYEDIGQAMTETYNDFTILDCELYGDNPTSKQLERIEKEISKLNINEYL